MLKVPSKIGLVRFRPVPVRAQTPRALRLETVKNLVLHHLALCLNTSLRSVANSTRKGMWVDLYRRDNRQQRQGILMCSTDVLKRRCHVLLLNDTVPVGTFLVRIGRRSVFP